MDGYTGHSGVGRPTKSHRSYQHSGRKDSTHHSHKMLYCVTMTLLNNNKLAHQYGMYLQNGEKFPSVIDMSWTLILKQKPMHDIKNKHASK